MTENISFKVTKENIKNGVRRYKDSCPIANSLIGHLKACIYVDVHNISFAGKKWSLPWNVMVRIFFYDNFGVMSPFTLKVPKKYVEHLLPTIKKQPVYGEMPLLGEEHYPKWKATAVQTEKCYV